MNAPLLDEEGNPMTFDKALDLYEEGDEIPIGTMAFIRAEVERLRAIEMGTHDLLADLAEASPTEVLRAGDLVPVLLRILGEG